MLGHKRTILGSAVAAALISGSAMALDFSATYSFGDSLSDSGAYKGAPDAGNGGKFTNDPGNVWVQNLADFFGTESIANNPNNPDNTDEDGTNYAQGGAQVDNEVGIGQSDSPQSADPVSEQIDNYLASHEHADANALYTLWAGANDVFYNLALLSAGIPPEMVQASLAGSATELVAQAERLSGAGARYILMPNLPDIGVTPSQVLQVVLSAGEGNPNLNNALIAAVTVLAMGGTDLNTVQMNALAAAEAALGYPAGALTPAFLQLSGTSTNLTLLYNAVLLAAMNGSSANLIPLDTYTMIQEIVANPGAFGLINVSGVACATSSSLPCTNDTLVDPMAADYFLFADGVHPTTAGHEIISDYAVSVLTAPALVANLPEVTLGAVRGHQQMILNQARYGKFGDQWSVFADVGMGQQSLAAGQAWEADSDDLHLMFGAGRKVSEHMAIGFALEKTSAEVDFGNNMGSFDLDGIELSGFLDYRNGDWFANGILTLGLQNDLDDIQRDIKLGGGYRLEQGDTQADVFAAKMLLGYDLIKSNELRAGPFASLNWQTVDVDGYREAGDRATSMNFAAQDRDSLLGELGLFARYGFAQSELYGSVSYESEFKDDPRTVTAGLNSLPGSSFDLYDIQPAEDAVKFDLSLSGHFDSVHAGIGYTYRRVDGDNDDHMVSVGFQIDL